jgi:hypothetical protein
MEGIKLPAALALLLRADLGGSAQRLLQPPAKLLSATLALHNSLAIPHGELECH